MSKQIKKRRRYRRYTAEFKRDAVRLVEQEGLTAAQVARDLGVNANSIHNWLKQHDETSGGQLDPQEKAELLQLRKGVWFSL